MQAKERRLMMKKNKEMTSFEADLMEKLRDPEFASNYIMSAILDNDMAFMPIALGDVAKAHGMSKLANVSGINRRTLYKIFDKQGNPSFEVVSRVLENLGLELQVRPKKGKKAKAS
jgi:probable addiction module antidote protein